MPSITKIITPRSMQGWGFAAESGTTFSGELTATQIVSAGTVGAAGARLSVDDTASGGYFGFPGWTGLPFSAILMGFYATLKEVGDPAPLPTLQINIAADVTDPTTNQTWQGRAVFEPYYTGAPTSTLNTWQRWNFMHGAGWWFTKAPLSNFAGINNPTTWGNILAHYPNMGTTVNPALAAILFKVGSGWNNFVGYVNDFTIASPIWPQVVHRWWFAPTTDYDNYYGYVDI